MIDLHHGDCTQVMRGLAENSVDAIVTDPPYGLSFMGKGWDHGVPEAATWADALRVLKPGGYLLAFGGTRTYHRMACAIEDAGFEIRDQIGWVFSSGFPKSHNLDRERGNAICGCGSTPEHNLRDMRDPDVSKAALAASGNGEVLQQGLSESGLHSAVPREKSGEGLAGGHQSSLEGWRDDVQEEGQLQGHSLPPSTGLDEANGTQGRLRHGAPDGDGRVVRIPADTDGSGASHQSRPDPEPANESGAVAGQPESQDGGAWPVCRGCGKPILPKGLGTALKPAWEPICVARKPLTGTVVSNVLEHGTGALNIDGCRVLGEAMPPNTGSGGLPRRSADEIRGPGIVVAQPHIAGRWPANLIHDGSDEVLATFPDAVGQIADASSSSSRKTQHVYGAMKRGNGREGEASAESDNDGAVGFKMKPGARRGDTGSAARFFYCAKADRADRNDGCEHMERKPLNWSSGTQNPGSFQAEGTDRTSPNHHPTVKPTDLMRYLCRLVTPKNGIVLDPFMGSGSTGRGAVLEGFRFVGIELDAEYLAIARARIDAARRQGHQPDLLDAT